MKWIAIAITVSKKTILFPCGGLINQRRSQNEYHIKIIYNKYSGLYFMVICLLQFNVFLYLKENENEHME